MKTDIHPNYAAAQVTCTCGNTFTTRSTTPEIHVELILNDDQVDIGNGVATAPASLAGLLEVRGLGIVRLPHRAEARLRLIIELDGRAERMPSPRRHAELDLPVVQIAAAAASKAQAFVRHVMRQSNGQTPPGAAHFTQAVSTLRTLRWLRPGRRTRLI